jgi:hypothetical protein
LGILIGIAVVVIAAAMIMRNYQRQAVLLIDQTGPFFASMQLKLTLGF